MIKKGVFPQFGFSPNYLPLVYLSDAINGIMLALENGELGEKYIIADNDPHDTKMLRKYVLSSLGIKRKFYPVIPAQIALIGAYTVEKLFKSINIPPPIKLNNIKSILAARRLSIDKAKHNLQFYPKMNFKGKYI
ncbi:radical SAM domain-containing protein [Candidatus Magnetoovum chiemensis]|nr:radical SAM domain-containing protein [Candidatus Magnetoovum chiemensis]